MKKHCSFLSFIFFIALQFVSFKTVLAEEEFQFPEQTAVVKSSSRLIKSDTLLQIEIELNVDSNWIVYDSIAGDVGPIPFTINFTVLENVQVEWVKKSTIKKKFDEVFETYIYYFEKEAVYTVCLKQVDASLPFSIAGSYEYMSCNLSSGVCLPPVNNSFDFKEK